MASEGIFPFVPLDFEKLPLEEMQRRAADFEEWMKKRRSVREFAPDPVPRELVETAIRVASSAPSGANQQPWHFVLVSDPQVKKQIRIAAEDEERESYEHRMPDDWLEAVAPLGTDWRKEFLEIAPYLIVVFRKEYGIEHTADGGERKVKYYYVQESVGIACGFLLAALHWMGLATLTHTPSPMGFLARILNRPPNERAHLLIPVGFPASDSHVPDIQKKALKEILTVV